VEQHQRDGPDFLPQRADVFRSGTGQGGRREAAQLPRRWRWLIASPAETSGILFPAFTAVEFPGVFFYRRMEGGAPRSVVAGQRVPAFDVAPSSPPKEAPQEPVRIQETEPLRFTGKNRMKVRCRATGRGRAPMRADSLRQSSGARRRLPPTSSIPLRITCSPRSSRNRGRATQPCSRSSARFISIRNSCSPISHWAIRASRGDAIATRNGILEMSSHCCKCGHAVKFSPSRRDLPPAGSLRSSCRAIEPAVRA